MALQFLSGPASEPVSLAEAKSHLRVDLTNEDLLIGSLITAARIHVEVMLSRALLTQNWALFLDDWPADGVLSVPIAPLQSVDLVRVYDASGDFSIVPADSYDVDDISEPARVVRRSGAVWPSPGRSVNGIEVQFACGYGHEARDVPNPIRQALLQLVAHWYERREPVALGSTSVDVPKMATSLLAPYQAVRL